MPGPLEFMRLALREAERGMRRGDGGPFGTCIVRGGRLVALGHNRVLGSGDPTQHAEIVAIHRASRRLGSHVLAGCTLYSTTEPCPMCFAAIHWARIDGVRFGTTIADVRRLGFNELSVSNRTLKRLGASPVRLGAPLARAECRALLVRWKALPNRRTY